MKKLRKRTKKLQQFVSSSKPGRVGVAYARDFIATVMVDCDFNVPETWPSHSSHPNMTPYEYFSEMILCFDPQTIPLKS